MLQQMAGHAPKDGLAQTCTGISSGHEEIASGVRRQFKKSFSGRGRYAAPFANVRCYAVAIEISCQILRCVPAIRLVVGLTEMTTEDACFRNSSDC